MNSTELREQMIRSMQRSLKFIRQLMDVSMQEFSEFVGVTRQTINNLENNKSTLSATQYIAVSALIDNAGRRNPDIVSAIDAVIKANARDVNVKPVSEFNNSFLERWFKSFNDNYLFYEQYLSGRKILADSTALLNENIFALLADVLPDTGDDYTKAVIPARVIEKLISMKERGDGLSDDAAEAEKNIADLSALPAVTIRGEDSDPYNENELFEKIFGIYREKYKLALITQNISLANDVMKKYGDDDIVFVRINENNEFECYNRNELKETSDEEQSNEEQLMYSDEKGADNQENEVGAKDKAIIDEWGWI